MALICAPLRVLLLLLISLSTGIQGVFGQALPSGFQNHYISPLQITVKDGQEFVDAVWEFGMNGIDTTIILDPPNGVLSLRNVSILRPETLAVFNQGTISIVGRHPDVVLDTAGKADLTPEFIGNARLQLINVTIINGCLRPAIFNSVSKSSYSTTYLLALFPPARTYLSHLYSGVTIYGMKFELQVTTYYFIVAESSIQFPVYSLVSSWGFPDLPNPQTSALALTPCGMLGASFTYSTILFQNCSLKLTACAANDSPLLATLRATGVLQDTQYCTAPADGVEVPIRNGSSSSMATGTVFEDPNIPAVPLWYVSDIPSLSLATFQAAAFIDKTIGGPYALPPILVYLNDISLRGLIQPSVPMDFAGPILSTYPSLLMQSRPGYLPVFDIGNFKNMIKLTKAEAKLQYKQLILKGAALDLLPPVQGVESSSLMSSLVPILASRGVPIVNPQNMATSMFLEECIVEIPFQDFVAVWALYSAVQANQNPSLQSPWAVLASQDKILSCLPIEYRKHALHVTAGISSSVPDDNFDSMASLVTDPLTGLVSMPLRSCTGWGSQLLNVVLKTRPANDEDSAALKAMRSCGAITAAASSDGGARRHMKTEAVVGIAVGATACLVLLLVVMYGGWRMYSRHKSAHGNIKPPSSDSSPRASTSSAPDSSARGSPNHHQLRTAHKAKLHSIGADHVQLSGLCQNTHADSDTSTSFDGKDLQLLHGYTPADVDDAALYLILDSGEAILDASDQSLPTTTTTTAASSKGTIKSHSKRTGSTLPRTQATVVQLQHNLAFDQQGGGHAVEQQYAAEQSLPLVKLPAVHDASAAAKGRIRSSMHSLGMPAGADDAQVDNSRGSCQPIQGVGAAAPTQSSATENTKDSSTSNAHGSGILLPPEQQDYMHSVLSMGSVCTASRLAFQQECVFLRSELHANRVKEQLMQPGDAAMQKWIALQTGKKDSNKVVIHDIIGSGGSSNVFRAEWRGMEVALKCIVFEGPPGLQAQGVSGCAPSTGPNSQNMSDMSLGNEGSTSTGSVSDSDDDRTEYAYLPAHQRAIREASIACSLVHPKLVTSYTFDVKPVEEVTPARHNSNSLKIHRDDTNSQLDDGSVAPQLVAYKLYLVQELCDMSLTDMLQSTRRRRPDGSREPLELGTSLAVLLDMALALEHLHSKNIIHADLKPDNILIKLEQQAGPVAKLTDFGLSTLLREGASYVSNYKAGSALYMAPEVREQGRASKASDVYSFGVVAWQLFSGQEVYVCGPDAGPGGKNPRIGTFDSKPLPHHSIQQTVHRCLSEDPKTRPTAKDIVAVLFAVYLKHVEGAASR